MVGVQGGLVVGSWLAGCFGSGSERGQSVGCCGGAGGRSRKLLEIVRFVPVERRGLVSMGTCVGESLVVDVIEEISLVRDNLLHHRHLIALYGLQEEHRLGQMMKF